MNTVRLGAASLWSKWGFHDGDVFSSCDWCNDDEFEQWRPVWDSEYDPLCSVVRKYLIPEIERRTQRPCRVEEICSGHNPIRAAEFGSEMPDDLRGIWVDVTLEQVLECMK